MQHVTKIGLRTRAAKCSNHNIHFLEKDPRPEEFKNLQAEATVSRMDPGTSIWILKLPLVEKVLKAVGHSIQARDKEQPESSL